MRANNMKKVLITGSLGYLGSVFTEYLPEHGYECIGYDTGFFKDGILYPPKPTTTVMRDARDITEKDLDGVYAVVHLAGISNDPFGNLDAARIYDPTRVYARAVAEICKKKRIKFVFASSCSVYGVGGNKILDEDSETSPQTPYSVNKLQIEQDLRAMAVKGGFSPVALRFATAFGLSPRMRFDVVTNMFVGMAVATGKISLASDGSAWRPNVHVLDIAEAVRCAIETDWNGGLLVLNVGEEAGNMTVLDIAKIVRDSVSGSEIEFLRQQDKGVLVKNPTVVGEKDTRTYTVSFERIRKYFPGYRVAWPMAKGVAHMVAKLKTLKLSEAEFKDKKYYRLRTISYLHDNHYISDDLRWLKSR